MARELISAESRRYLETLKACFKGAPLLAHFDLSKRQILFVDNSKYALLEVLSQPDDLGAIKPVLFLSNKWNDSETSWQLHNQELGALLQAFVEWLAWLINTNDLAEVMLDHSNLCYFMSSKHLSDRQARWAAYLTLFHFVIKHIPGKANPADPETRRPNSEEPNSDCQLLEDTPAGLRLMGQGTQDTDTIVKLGEVSSADVLHPNGAPDTDLFFCPPLEEFIRLLKLAYEDKTLEADEEADLKKWGISGGNGAVSLFH